MRMPSPPKASNALSTPHAHMQCNQGMWLFATGDVPELRQPCAGVSLPGWLRSQQFAIQSSPGAWDETGLRRIDLVLSQAAQYGILVIGVPTNFEPLGGGMQWYVDQVSTRPSVQGVMSRRLAIPLVQL